MKQIAFLSLVATLFISQFQLGGASISNNTIAIALILLLLVVFSDLAEFNFWGIRGKREEEELKRLLGKKIIVDQAIKPPSPYKVRQAEKLDLPTQMSRSRENFLATSFEIERLLRVIARSINSKTLNDAAVTPQLVLEQLNKEKLLTATATNAIKKIRELRERLMRRNHQTISPEILEANQILASEIYTELKRWLEQSRSGKA